MYRDLDPETKLKGGMEGDSSPPILKICHFVVVVVVVVVYFILRSVIIAFSANLGLLCMPYPTPSLTSLPKDGGVSCILVVYLEGRPSSF